MITLCCIKLIIIYLFIFYPLSFLVPLFTDFEFLARLLVKEVPQVTQDISEVALIDDVISHDMLMRHVSFICQKIVLVCYISSFLWLGVRNKIEIK